jgi:methionyl-tRNA formyltransferase
LRIVFFGTPAFSVPTFEALLASRHRVVAAVTQPDRPRGRGQQTSDAPIKRRAAEAGIDVLQPTALRQPAFTSSLRDLGADLGVVVAYGRLLPDAVLAVPPLGLVNVHASLLPRYRGAAPVHRAVIAGERETGVTIMRVVSALDAGPMLAAARHPIGPDETSSDVERALAELGARLLAATVDRLAAGEVEEMLQDESEATYAPRLTREEGLVDWSRRAPAIHNLVRGLHPWPHAYSYLNGHRLILRRSSLPAPDEPTAAAAPGTVVAARQDRFLVATGEGLLALREIQAEGKRTMEVRDFLAGHRVAPGDRFMQRP